MINPNQSPLFWSRNSPAYQFCWFCNFNWFHLSIFFMKNLHDLIIWMQNYVFIFFIHCIFRQNDRLISSKTMSWLTVRLLILWLFATMVSTNLFTCLLLANESYTFFLWTVFSSDVHFSSICSRNLYRFLSFYELNWLFSLPLQSSIRSSLMDLPLEKQFEFLADAEAMMPNFAWYLSAWMFSRLLWARSSLTFRQL